MRNLYKYEGLVGSISYRKGEGTHVSTADIILDDIYEEGKAPVGLRATGGLAEYIENIGWTDAEERYIKCDYYYDNTLVLKKIEVPGKNGTPAKVIIPAGIDSNDVVIFGEQNYIETSEPEGMSGDEMIRMFQYEELHESRWFD